MLYYKLRQSNAFAGIAGKTAIKDENKKIKSPPWKNQGRIMRREGDKCEEGYSILQIKSKHCEDRDS